MGNERFLPAAPNKSDADPLGLWSESKGGVGCFASAQSMHRLLVLSVLKSADSGLSANELIMTAIHNFLDTLQVGTHNRDVMSKRLSVRRSEIEDYRKNLLASAKQTQIAIAELVGTEEPMAFLLRLKFQQVGCDPLNLSRQLNLIEQLNQTFTYLASFNSAEFLFARHPNVHNLTLNLGTSSGSDIETKESGGIAAEVFAAVTPQNNRKLAGDIKKVSATDAEHRYVLFMSPEHEAGPYRGALKAAGVLVWSLGCSL